MRVVRYFIILLGLFLSLNAISQKKNSKPIPFAREFKSEGDTLRYRIIYPDGYDKQGKEKYPLVIFLHNENSHGSDNTSQMKCGSSIFLNNEMRHFFPAIVIFPQCPIGEKWADYEFEQEYIQTPIVSYDSIVTYKTDSISKMVEGELIQEYVQVPIVSYDTVPSYRIDTLYKFKIEEDPKSTKYGDLLFKLIHHYQKNKTVDTDKIYIMGISTGAIGALDLAVREPKSFAAVVSISGAISPTRMKALKKTPVRLYHGANDSIIPIDYSRDSYYELKANGLDDAEIIEYSGAGHEIWREAMSSSDFLKWVFSKEK